MIVNDFIKVQVTNHLLIEKNEEVNRLVSLFSKPIPNSNYGLLVWLCELYKVNALDIIHNTKIYTRNEINVKSLFIYFVIDKYYPYLIQIKKFKLNPNIDQKREIKKVYTHIKEILPITHRSAINISIDRVIYKLRKDKIFQNKIHYLELLLRNNNWYYK